MNSSVSFLNDAKPVTSQGNAAPRIVVPAGAVRNDSVFIVLNGKVIARQVKTGSTTAKGVVVEQGLNGGEDLVLAPPATLKNGDRVHVKGA
jgi:hypothetical protein